MKRDEKKIRIVLVDEDPAMRDAVQRMLDNHPATHVVAQSQGTAATVRTIQAYRPEIAVLPLRLRDGTALDVVEQVGPDQMPSPVFTCAPDEHIDRALRESGFASIPCPVTEADLTAAVERIRVERQRPGANADLARRLSTLLAHARMQESGEGADSTLARFVIRERNRVHTIPAEEVDWIEGARNYVRLHVGERTHLLRGPLTAIHAQLDQKLFARIHRSIIVNVDRVGEVQPWVGGDYVAVLRSGKRLRVSRNFRETILRLAS